MVVEDDLGKRWFVTTPELKYNSQKVTLNLLHFVVYTASGDGTVRVYNTKSGSCKRVYKGHEHAINALVVSANDL